MASGFLLADAADAQSLVLALTSMCKIKDKSQKYGKRE